MTPDKRSGRRPATIAVLVSTIAALAAVATAVQAIRLDSWGPVWATGWLPAVLLASLRAPASHTSCRLRLRSLARR
jgi:hypothetical protein